MKRVFLVGCSRSGTSVVQSLLACHPSVTSFPESDYFTALHRNTRRGRLIELGLATRREQSHLRRWLQRIGRPDLAADVLPQPIRFAPAVHSYIGVLDRMAADAGKGVWIEKTPLHVLYTNLIDRYVPDATVLHLVREGREVVASIHDRAVKYGGPFQGQDDIDVGIDLWNRCMEATIASVRKPNHHIVMYEQFVSDPLGFANRVGSVLGLTYEAADLRQREGQVGSYVLQAETWKRGVGGPIRARTSKFNSLLSDEQRAYVERRLHLSQYDAAASAALV